jgi:hypothetical protein
MEEFHGIDLGRLIPELTGEEGLYPAGGAVAALVAALAASLTAAAADRSREGWDEAPGTRAQAQALRRRATELVQRERVGYAVARKALAERGMAEGEAAPGDAGEGEGVEGEAGQGEVVEPTASDWALGVIVREAAGPPLELAAIAADIAALAALVAERGAGEVQADAAVAAALAAAAAQAAAALVRVNLVVGGASEPALRAARHANEAAAAATLAARSGA